MSLKHSLGNAPQNGMNIYNLKSLCCVCTSAFGAAVLPPPKHHMLTRHFIRYICLLGPPCRSKLETIPQCVLLK